MKKELSNRVMEAFMQYLRDDGVDTSTTWVRKDMKGKENEYNACISCMAYRPFTPEDNCGYAGKIQKIYEDWGITLVVWECPVMEFEKEEGWTCASCAALNGDDSVNCSYCGINREEI